MSAATDRPHDHLLFAGTHGHVVAIDKASGKTVWKTKLPDSSYQVVSILYEDGSVFCAARGFVYALDPDDGRFLWTNDLPGLRHGIVVLNTAQSSRPESLMAVLAAHQASVRSAQTGGATGSS